MINFHKAFQTSGNSIDPISRSIQSIQMNSQQFVYVCSFGAKCTRAGCKGGVLAHLGNTVPLCAFGGNCNKIGNGCTRDHTTVIPPNHGVWCKPGFLPVAAVKVEEPEEVISAPLRAHNALAPRTQAPPRARTYAAPQARTYAAPNHAPNAVAAPRPVAGVQRAGIPNRAPQRGGYKQHSGAPRKAAGWRFVGSAIGLLEKVNGMQSNCAEFGVNAVNKLDVVGFEKCTGIVERAMRNLENARKLIEQQLKVVQETKAQIDQAADEKVGFKKFYEQFMEAKQADSKADDQSDAGSAGAAVSTTDPDGSEVVSEADESAFTGDDALDPLEQELEDQHEKMIARDAEALFADADDKTQV